MQEKEELTPDESAEITMTDSTNVTEEQAEGSTEQLVTDETTELKKQVEEARNKYLYLVADFENIGAHCRVLKSRLVK